METVRQAHIIVAKVTCGSQAVLVLNPKGGDRNRWQFPGGRVREDSNLINEAIRVLKEELGVDIPPASLKEHKKVNRNKEQVRQIVHFFHVELNQYAFALIPTESGDGHLTRKVPVNILAKNLGPADKELFSG